MANERRGRVFNFIQQNTVGVAAVIVILLIFLPMPQILVDISMVLNIALSIVILLVIIYTPRASDFETFPRVVLAQTLFSLAINISSTRLILTGKMVGRELANQSLMVKAFAQIVAGDNLVVGIIIFIFLVVVQFMVSKGASRVSEVAARFTLDSMPNKYMDVDNRLNLGAIDADEAERLKNAIRKEIDFYSNMDGATKFVSGNVKVGLVITAVNLIAGLVIGMLFNHMAIGDAARTYSNLTIGDGLTSQLPSLIISISTGLLVTGTKSDSSFDSELKGNFTTNGIIYVITGGVLVVAGIALNKGTQFVLVPMGGLLIWLGTYMNGRKKKVAVAEAKKAEEQAVVAKRPKVEHGVEMLDPLTLELGFGLIPLADANKGAELLDRMNKIRIEARLDMGFDVPDIRILDNLTLKADDYSFKIDGIEAGHATIRLGYVLCLDTGTVVTPMKGEKTKDPAFGMDAIWVPESEKADAESAGYVVVDPATVISTHITEIIRSHAAQLLDRQAVSAIIDRVKEKNPVLVDEVLHTANISYGTIEKVFQNLLEEKVSIRNYVRILETMANYAGVSKSSWDLTEKVREALGLQICMQYVDPEEKKLRVMNLSPELCEFVADHAYYPPDGSKPYVAFDPVDRRKWIKAVSNSLANVSRMGFIPIILCPSQIRQLVRSSIENENPGVVVLSEVEIYAARNSIAVEVVDVINSEENA